MATATEKANSTIVRNTSGVAKFFAFLGSNGVQLAAGADYAHPGDLRTRWMNDTIQTAALNYALVNGLIEILSTPAVLVYDVAATRVYKLGASSNAANVQDPDYGSYTGAAPSP